MDHDDPRNTGPWGLPTATVVIADADPLARSVVRRELERDGRFEIVGETGEANALESLCARHAPDVVVLEPQIATGEPADLVRALARLPAAPRIVAFSLQDDDDLAVGIVRAGADGFLGKREGEASITPAIEAVLRGEVAISRTMTMRVIELLRAAPQGGTGLRPVQSPLTDREWEVLDMLGDGCSTREISERLVLSEVTVYSHVKSILRKLGVHSREEAVDHLRAMRDPLDP